MTSHPEPASTRHRPVALVTGVGRTIGIGAGIATGLAADGWDIALSYWNGYDARMPWGVEPAATATITDTCRAHGARTTAIEADLAETDQPEQLFDQVTTTLGPVSALVLAHCESVPSDLRSTTVESFERHFAVNTRASWQLIRQFALRFPGPHGTGRIISLTSDHTTHHIPYGASKAALDRITLAAAHELTDLGVTANVVNPGPIDTGWMPEQMQRAAAADTPLGRLGTPTDTAHLVRFLCSEQGQWINGQLLSSNGGWPLR